MTWVLKEMDRVFSELRKPVLKETWVPVQSLRTSQICALCWEVIYAGPSKPPGRIAAWKRLEGSVFECCECRSQSA